MREHVIERRCGDPAFAHAGLEAWLELLIAIEGRDTHAGPARRDDIGELLPPVALLLQARDLETERLCHPGEVRERHAGAGRCPELPLEEVLLSLPNREI